MEEERNYCVYMHIAPNGKKYVGITCQKVNRRWRNGKGYWHNEYFTKAIKKYGWDNFKHIIIVDQCTKEEACNIEIELINKYNTTNINYGYNLVEGGDCHKLSENQIIKMSKPVVQFDKYGKYVDKFKNVTEASIITGFSKDGIRKAIYRKQLSNGYQFRYEDDIQNISEYHDNVKKPVLQIDPLTNRIIQKFLSITEAAETVGASPVNIGQCCMLKCYSISGYIWRYEGEENKKYNLKTWRTKSVFRIDNNNVKKKYNSIEEAAIDNNIKSGSNISAACRGERKTAGGYRWEYADEDEVKI